MSMFGKLFSLVKPKAEKKPAKVKTVYFPNHGVKKPDSKRSQKFGPKKD